MARKKILSLVLVLVATYTFGGCGDDNSPADPNLEPHFGLHNVRPGEQVRIPGFDLLMRDITYFAGSPIIHFDIVGTDQLIGPFMVESLSYNSLENLKESSIDSPNSYSGIHVDIRSVVENEVEIEIQPYERSTIESISSNCVEVVLNVGDQVVVPGGVVHVKTVSYNTPYTFLRYHSGNAEYDFVSIPQGWGVPLSFVEGVSFGIVTVEDRAVTFSALCLLE